MVERREQGKKIFARSVCKKKREEVALVGAKRSFFVAVRGLQKDISFLQEDRAMFFQFQRKKTHERDARKTLALSAMLRKTKIGG